MKEEVRNAECGVRNKETINDGKVLGPGHEMVFGEKVTSPTEAMLKLYLFSMSSGAEAAPGMGETKPLDLLTENKSL